jgi:hypothetical protein
MTKFLIGILASASLIACVDSASDSQSQDNRYTVGDRTLRLEDASKSSDQQSFLPGPDEIDGSCWVTLEWCSEPGTGDAVCTFTNCTISRAISACESLIGSTC